MTETIPSDDLSKLPTRLSPSRAGDFATCPKMFRYKTIDRLPVLPTVATSVGTLAHAVFEHIFDLPRAERTLERALEMVGPAWEAMLVDESERSRSEGYLTIAPRGSETEAEILAGAHTMVERWSRMERMQNFDPQERELWVQAEFEGVTLAGILDRLDSYEGVLEGEGPRTIWVISDYKTGSIPKEEYLSDAFKPMQVYALLLKEQLGIEVDLLRLVYVKSGDREKGVKTLRVRPAMLAAAKGRMLALRQGMEDAARSGEWPAKVGVLCGWCSFQEICTEGKAEVARRAALKAEREKAQAPA